MLAAKIQNCIRNEMWLKLLETGQYVITKFWFWWITWIIVWVVYPQDNCHRFVPNFGSVLSYSTSNDPPTTVCWCVYVFWWISTLCNYITMWHYSVDYIAMIALPVCVCVRVYVMIFKLAYWWWPIIYVRIRYNGIVYPCCVKM